MKEYMPPKVIWGTFERGLYPKNIDEHKQLRSSIVPQPLLAPWNKPTRIHFISRLGKLNSFTVGTARL